MIKWIVACWSALALVSAGPVAAQEWDPVLHDIDALFDKFATDNHAPGLIYGVVRDGELVHLHTFGVQDLASRRPVSDDTVFRIASLTKSFTALAVLNLRDEGQLDLDATAESLVPGLRFVPPSDESDAPILVRQLLAHSAGLVTDDPWGDRQLDMSEAEFTRYLQEGIPLATVPGRGFEYSNTGYALLGRAISNVSEQPYQDYVAQILFRPLRMNATVWQWSDVPVDVRATGYSWVDGHHEEQPVLADGAYGAMAGMSTTATDYARYVAWLLSAWQPAPTRLKGSVAPSTVREAGRGLVLSQVGQRPNGPDGEPCPVAWQYGAGLYVVTDCELGTMLRHPGGLPGYGSQLLLLPEAGVGIFAFANLTYARLSDPVVEAAIQLKRAGLLKTPDPAPSAALAQAADAVLRMYRAGDIGIAGEEFASNLLLDRSVARRNASLGRDRAVLGDCGSIAPSGTVHALGGHFMMDCERGTMGVTLLLAPTLPPKIQILEFEAHPAPSNP